MRHLIAIPVYNEERHLPNVLEAVRRHGHDVLVIDDGSTDRTPELLREQRGVLRLTHPENRGYGQSLIDAFRFAGKRGYDWITTIDCDEQHEPAQIPEFLACAERGEADVVSGSRYLGADTRDDPPPPERFQINMTINRLLRRTLGLRLTDSFCGFKSHRVEAMGRLSLDEPGYAFPLQFWVEAARVGLRIVEIPVRRIYRDLSREFGGTLDDPRARLVHYREVFRRSLRRARQSCADTAADCGCPQTS